MGVCCYEYFIVVHRRRELAIVWMDIKFVTIKDRSSRALFKCRQVVRRWTGSSPLSRFILKKGKNGNALTLFVLLSSNGKYDLYAK